jgi:hypothetical protein
MNASGTWVFGYGSLIWNRENITIVEERIGELQNYHRDWTWISKERRHGAPTCNLQPGGRVKGVFLKLDSRTCDADLKILRKRELRSSEKVINLPGITGDVHFWTMENNLAKYYNIKELKDSELYGFLANIAKRIPDKGPDGKTAVEYALAVHEFDPADEITKRYVDALRQPESGDRKDPTKAIQAVKARIGSLKSNRNFLTALFTVESVILTFLAGYLKIWGTSLLMMLVWSLTSLVAAVLSVFALTDSIHFYSKYLEYSFAWIEEVHGRAYRGKTSDDKAKGDLRRALEADDLGYYWAKFAFLFFLWFVSSFVFVSELDMVWKMVIFLLSVTIVTFLALYTYKITHQKCWAQAVKSFFVRKPVFGGT